MPFYLFLVQLYRPKRVQGFVFVPGIDLGLTYSPGMMALMEAKLPFAIRHDFIVFGNRYTGTQLVSHGVVSEAVAPGEVLPTSVARAVALRPKTKNPRTMGRIKETLYHVAIAALECEPDELLVASIGVTSSMGFDVVPTGTDKPMPAMNKHSPARQRSLDVDTRRRQSLAVGLSTAQSDLVKLATASEAQQREWQDQAAIRV